MSHHSNTDPAVMRRLGRIDRALSYLIEKVEKMALDFTRLETEVAEIGTVVDSAVTLLQSIAQDIRDNVANQTKLLALADNLETKANALGEAVAANTPADPAIPTAG